MTGIGDERPRYQVLVVDDNLDNLRVLKKLLEKANYSVKTATNGTIALASAQTVLPDLILLDILMPGIDGYEVCNRLKTNDRTRDIPVIFISGQNDVTDKVKAFDLGAVDYITKPFQIAEILARIKTHITLRGLQRQLQEQNAILEREVRDLTHPNQPTFQLSVVLGKTLVDLPTHEFQVSSTTPGQVVIEMFRKHPKLPGVIVADGEKILGMIARSKVFEYFGRPFGLEMFSKRPIAVLLSAIYQAESADGLQPYLLLSPDCTVQAAVSQALDRPEPYTYEPIVIQQPNHTWQLLAMNTLLLAYSRLFAYSNAILQETDEELQLVLGITQAINAAPDFNSALEVALHSLGEVTGWLYGEAWVESADRTVLECSSSWYGDRLSLDPATLESLDAFRQYSEALTFLPGEGLPGRAWQQRQPEWTTDISTKLDEVFLRHEQAVGCGFVAGFAVPIVAPLDPYQVNSQDQVIAVLVFLSQTQRPQDERWIRLVPTIATQLGSALAQKQAQAELRALFAAMNDIVLVRDASGRCLKVAPTSKTDLYKPVHEMLGKRLSNVMPAAQANHVLACIQESLREQTTVRTEYKLPLEDRDLWLSTTISPLTDNLVVIVGRDITERKQAEAALRHSEAQNHAILAAIPDLLIRLRRDGTYLDYIPAKSKTAHKINSDQCLGKTIYDVLPPDYADLQMQRIEEALTTGNVITYEHQLVTTDGIPLDEEIRIVVSGEDEVLLIIRDITERKRLEQELRATNAQMRALFASMHELVVVRDRMGRCLKIPTTKAVGIYKSVEEQLGKTLHEVFPKTVADEMLGYIHQALDANDTVNVEYSLLHDDGQTAWSEASISPIDENSVVWVVRDITARKQAEQQLQVEKEKSEQLLLNILPETIADRLKQGNRAIADSFTDATILFADIAGFTSLSDDISPKELVGLLNRIFSSFDDLCEQFGLEKIKTIGDAYMVVGGLPNPRPDHIEAVIDMALAMQFIMCGFQTYEGRSVTIRIGINTGTVVAGVIGKKKFIYDLWGDAVNVASRMESQGEPGKIQVTQAIYDRLQDRYQFEERGVIPVKGKGDMTTYWLLGKKS